MNKEDCLHLIIAFGLLIFLTACGQSKQNSQDFPVTSLGAVKFTEGKSPNLNGARVVDSSLVGGTLYYDYEGGAFFAKSDELVDANSRPVIEVHPVGLNFTYVMAYGGILYRFGEHGNDIYLDSSKDGAFWTPLNGGRPIIEHSLDPNSDWNQLWNVGADVDADGVWHVLIECSDSKANQLNVGLCYAKGNLSGFSRVNPKQVITHGGNPYVKFVPDRGLLIIHGSIYTPKFPFGNEWYITASTLKNGESKFVTHREEFTLGTPGIHDCDPHMTESSDGGLTLVFSVDQSHLQTVTTKTTFEQFFDILTGAI